ncbi:MAG: sugar-binding transcriptional regulator [Anaerolineae bacterium]|nr:sugar-binding transcriptional regulator [Anaerolineae bacterium]
MSFERLELLASVAELYYVEGRGQAEIAHRFGYSRSAISRLLAEARQNHLVEVRINHPIQRDTELEHILRARFGLESVFVAQRGALSYERTLTLLGRIAASYLEGVLSNDSTICISWGTAVYETVAALRPRRLRGAKVVQMIGGLGMGDSQIDGPGVAFRLAASLGAQCYTLNAPHITADRRTRDSLLSSRAVRDALALALQADYALIGIGSLVQSRSSLLRSGYLSAADLDAIRATGAVGDICGTHFDVDGRVLDIDVNSRIVGISVPEFRAGPCKTVAVSAGRIKAPAIAGALKGKFVDVLVTDSNAAEEVLALSR